MTKDARLLESMLRDAHRSGRRASKSEIARQVEEAFLLYGKVDELFSSFQSIPVLFAIALLRRKSAFMASSDDVFDNFADLEGEIWDLSLSLFPDDIIFADERRLHKRRLADNKQRGPLNDTHTGASGISPTGRLWRDREFSARHLRAAAYHTPTSGVTAASSDAASGHTEETGDCS